jgi:molybdate transport system permease protein
MASGRAERGDARLPPWPLLGAGALAAAFLALPLVGLIVRAPWGDLGAHLASPEIRSALRLSLVCSLSAALLCVILGVPLAWVLARAEFPGRGLLRGLATLPLVLPPVVGGVALLLALGRLGLVGRWLESLFGVRLFGTTAGVIVAETFVAMPLLVLTVEGALRAFDRRYEDAAATLGASRWHAFRRVTLPAIAPSLVAGAVLGWARALGEFGATITFAGNLPGRTQTVPIAVYVELQKGIEDAIVLSLVLVAVSLAVLVGLRDRWFPSS